MSTESSNEQVLELYEKAVDRALADRETRANLEERAAEGHDVSVEKIRQDLLPAPEPILVKVQTMRRGWESAEARLEEAREAQRRQIANIILALAAVGAVFAIVALLLLPDRERLLALVPLALPLLSFGRPPDLRIQARRRDRREAHERFVRALNTQTTVAVREATNMRLTSFSTTFEIFDQRGLRQLADPDREVSTTAVEELEELIASLDSGSIGLSGPRGCGKTTVINSFTRGTAMPFNKERLGLVVPAPVKYDPREFVLHLFASLCEEVLKERPDDLAGAGVRWAPGERGRFVWGLGLAALALLAAGFLITFGIPSLSREAQSTIAFALGGFLAYLWAISWFAGTPQGRRLGRRIVSSLEGESSTAAAKSLAEREAKGYLKQIRFQQSRDSSGSAKVSLFGFELGGGSTSSLARSAWTLPEAVEELRRFAGRLSHRFVVIGIDELDKLESDQAAREFLNNIKGVFGVPGCYYLVSVSEDAMSSFERRGLPMRDVFDSSFDEIQRIGYLTLAESRRVLESRVTGVPVPFQCLCHCLAGGLPRDLIRVMRKLVHEYEGAKKKAREAKLPFDPSLGDLTGTLVRSELRGKLAAATAAGLSGEQSQPWWLTRWLHEQEQTLTESAALHDQTVQLDGRRRAHSRDGGPDTDKALRMSIELMAFNYYAATILDLFGSDFVAPILQDPARSNWVDPGGVWAIETLAAARQQFSIAPWLSWGLIDEVRLSTEFEPWRGIRPAAW